jgi:hypothetical protein
MKVCTKCKVEKSLDCFTKANDKKYGLYSSCKDCQKKYYQANKQRLSDYTKEWRIKNKEYSKEYYQSTKPPSRTRVHPLTYIDTSEVSGVTLSKCHR